MNLRKEVLHRLLLAKSILSPARALAGEHPNAHVVARQVLNAHDAADLVFAAIADQQNRLPARNKAPSMLEYLRGVDTTAEKHTGYFMQLNEARNSLKHAGNLPNTNQWASVHEDVFQKLSSICEATLSMGLEEVDEIELLANEEAKAHAVSAKKAQALQEFKLALEEVGKALFVSLEERHDLGYIRVGRPNAEDALKLTAYGVSANAFLRLQEFLPMVWKFGSESFTVLWKQSQFGHPGNWREEVAEFCLGTYLSTALGIQSAPWVPHAIELSTLYDYLVTAKEDTVEVWEDVVEDPLSQVYGDNVRPTRRTKRYLHKGESISVSATKQPLVSDDLSLEGGPVKRVRVSARDMDNMYGLAGPERAEFVDLSKVEILCAPHSWGSEVFVEQFRGLSDIPWEEDPVEFSL